MLAGYQRGAALCPAFAANGLMRRRTDRCWTKAFCNVGQNDDAMTVPGDVLPALEFER